MSMPIQHCTIPKSICCTVATKISLKFIQSFAIQLAIVQCWTHCTQTLTVISVPSQRAGMAIKRALADQQIAWWKQNHEILCIHNVKQQQLVSQSIWTVCFCPVRTEPINCDRQLKCKKPVFNKNKTRKGQFIDSMAFQRNFPLFLKIFPLYVRW